MQRIAWRNYDPGRQIHLPPGSDVRRPGRGTDRSHPFSPGTSAGPIKKSFALYCDIIDEAGGIAAIATILAANRISIKNIGIIHNRSFEEGVLRIEFYEQEACDNAVLLLKKYRYIVYEA